MEILKFNLLIVSCFILGTVVLASLNQGETAKRYLVNTSNLGKQAEYKKYLDHVVFTNYDLKEPLSDPETIIRYKASQFLASVIVDDVSLFVEDADFGVNIRWRLADLSLPENIGKKARFVCYMARLKKDKVHMVSSEVKGTIVKPKGDGFGIGPHFLPEGGSLTLGQKMDRKYNPRYLALQKLINERDVKVLPLLNSWKGKFQ